MSLNDQSLIYEYFSNLTIYLLQKLNNYFLLITIIISIITLFLMLWILIESKCDSIKKHPKNHLFQSITSESCLNWLFNSSNHIKKRFFNVFIHSLNQEFFSKKVNKNILLSNNLSRYSLF